MIMIMIIILNSMIASNLHTHTIQLTPKQNQVSALVSTLLPILTQLLRYVVAILQYVVRDGICKPWGHQPEPPTQGYSSRPDKTTLLTQLLTQLFILGVPQYRRRKKHPAQTIVQFHLSGVCKLMFQRSEAKCRRSTWSRTRAQATTRATAWCEWWRKLRLLRPGWSARPEQDWRCCGLVRATSWRPVLRMVAIVYIYTSTWTFQLLNTGTDLFPLPKWGQISTSLEETRLCDWRQPVVREQKPGAKVPWKDAFGSSKVPCSEMHCYHFFGRRTEERPNLARRLWSSKAALWIRKAYLREEAERMSSHKCRMM